MSSPSLRDRRTAAPRISPRIGVIGLFGSGNLGNDGSLEAFLAAVRARYPDARVECMCDGPQEVMARFGVPATRLFWNLVTDRQASRNPAVRVLGKLLDTVRVASWTRRLDVVVVPGMGVLEDCLRVRPWSLPHALFVASAAGRVTGTRIALVNVGATVAEQPITRWFMVRAARLAYYRSYRDEFSRSAMQSMGVDEPDECVYPDLVFALPEPDGVEPMPGAVGVGVMGYWGEHEERAIGQQIHDLYLGELQRFVRWLVDQQRPVRLLVGDRTDEQVAGEILADLQTQRPNIAAGQVVAEPIRTMSDLMRQISLVETVVASRYHNVLAALKLGKPTMSIGYGVKNDVLMAERGLTDFCQSIRALDASRLCVQFTELQEHRAELVCNIQECNDRIRQRLDTQLQEALQALLDCPRPSALQRGHLRAQAYRR